MATLIKEVYLIKSEASVNANKWWRAELYDDGTVKAWWARVGYDPQSGEWRGGQSYLDKKLKEKYKKGYTDAPIVNTTGSLAPSGVTVATSDLREIAKKEIVKSSNKTLDALIDRLVKSNIHTITTNTNITYNAVTGFQTPLGIVTTDAIRDARNLLSKINPLVRSEDYGMSLNRLVNLYLRLIPQNIGMKFDVKKIFPNTTAVKNQNNILDSLEASYQAFATSTPTKSTTIADNSIVEPVFRVDIELIERGKEIDRLIKWFNTTKSQFHGYDDIKILNVFSIKIADMDDAFLRKDPNVKEVFHGTSEANCLSILKVGLKIRPPSTTKVAGDMFGPGLYGAFSSTKSLGYTYGKWGQSTGPSGWLYICDFAMGKMYESDAPNHTYGERAPDGYDSYWVKAGSRVKNDELIVYSENRANIKYLIECK